MSYIHVDYSNQVQSFITQRKDTLAKQRLDDHQVLAVRDDVRGRPSKFKAGDASMKAKRTLLSTCRINARNWISTTYLYR